MFHLATMIVLTRAVAENPGWVCGKPRTGIRSTPLQHSQNPMGVLRRPLGAFTEGVLMARSAEVDPGGAAVDPGEL